VLEARRSQSRPTAGIVEFEHRGFNQRDELVVVCRRQALMRTRPSDAPVPEALSPAVAPCAARKVVAAGQAV
jgi:hypothetical protein